MAHEPRPHGAFQHGAPASEEDVGVAAHTLKRLQALKAAGGLQGYKLVRDLPDGGQVIAIDQGGVVKTIIVKPDEIEPELQTVEQLIPNSIPMLFSGVVKSAVVKKGEPVEVVITEDTRRRLAGYKTEGAGGLTAVPPVTTLKLQKFVTEYHPIHGYFAEQNEVVNITQFRRMRPGWWGSRMAGVVQILLGFGIQDKSKLPKTGPDAESMVLPPDVYSDAMRQFMAMPRAPICKGVVDKQGQIKYQFSAGCTDFITYAEDGSPWLGRVNSDGVHVMPLPVIRLTETKAFRKYVEAHDDKELLSILDLFRGIPSGETFPGEDAFHAWKKAGAIIKVCGVSDFYDNPAFYENCGWAFNSSGREGFNTCYSYPGGLLTAHSYKLKILVGAPSYAAAWDEEALESSPELSSVLNAVLSAISDPDTRRAVAFKLRRFEVEEIISAGPNAAHWINAEAKPIASASGSVSKVASGPIYWPFPSREANWLLKFPVQDAKGCASFYMFSEDYSGPPKKCDTVVWGTYVADQLQVLKFFYDPAEGQVEEESNFEDCMIVGSWESRRTESSSKLMTNTYTTLFDEREVRADSEVVTRVTGGDLGYGAPAFTTPGLLVTVGGLIRIRYFSTTVETTSFNGYSAATAACVPVFDRGAVLFAHSVGSESKSYSVSATRNGVVDPNTYQLWTYDSLFHFMGSTNSGRAQNPPKVGLGEPKPKTGDRVFVDSYIYDPYPCSDFADSGDWFLKGAPYIDVSDICAPYTDRMGTHHATGVTIGGQAPHFDEYSTSETEHGVGTGYTGISFHGERTEAAGRPDGWYFAMSPLGDSYFYRQVVRVHFGEVVFGESGKEGEKQILLTNGYTSMRQHGDIFIGVINE